MIYAVNVSNLRVHDRNLLQGDIQCEQINCSLVYFIFREKESQSFFSRNPLKRKKKKKSKKNASADTELLSPVVVNCRSVIAPYKVDADGRVSRLASHPLLLAGPRYTVPLTCAPCSEICSNTSTTTTAGSGSSRGTAATSTTIVSAAGGSVTTAGSQAANTSGKVSSAVSSAARLPLKGYQPLVCRNPPLASKSEASCTLTFENLYAADERSSSNKSSSDENVAAKQTLLGSASSSTSNHEEDFEQSADNSIFLSQAVAEMIDPPIVLNSAAAKTGTVPCYENMSSALKPLMYPDSTLLTAGSSDSGLLHTNRHRDSLTGAEVPIVVPPSETSQLQNSNVSPSPISTSDDEKEFNETGVANEQDKVTSERPLDATNVRAADNFLARVNDDRLKLTNDSCRSNQAVIFNLDMDQVNEENDGRIISAVNPNVCSSQLERNNGNDTIEIGNTIDDSQDYSESNSMLLKSAYENVLCDVSKLCDGSSAQISCSNPGSGASGDGAQCIEDISKTASKEVFSNSPCHNNDEGDGSSNPDIDWLFCHSDSDSEFADLAKWAPQPPSQFYEHSQAPDETDGDGHNSSQRLIKSNEQKDIVGLSSASGFQRCSSSTVVGDSAFTDESIAQQQLQGAIPKRKRHGIIMDDPSTVSSNAKESSLHALVSCTDKEAHEPVLTLLTSTSTTSTISTSPTATTPTGEVGGTNDNISAAGEVSSVTMDLMKRMLDVFSSYPEHCHIDIKKLLVLVSLEQQNNTGGMTGGTGSTSTLPTDPSASTKQSSPLQPEHNSQSGCGGAISPLATTAHHKLHRKPAVRRRKYGSSSSASPPPVSPPDNAYNTPVTTTFPGIIGQDINYQPAVITHEEVQFSFVQMILICIYFAA